MATLLVGAEQPSWRGINLGRYLARVTDTIGVRTVVYEYAKRDGAAGETFGRRPLRTVWDLDIGGRDWIALQRRLVAALEESPRGLLVHPIYGQMVVLVEELRGTTEPPRSLSATQVSLSFVSVSLDTALGASEVLPVAEATQALRLTTATLTEEIAATTPALVSTAAPLATAAGALADAADVAITDPTAVSGAEVTAALAETSRARTVLLAALGDQADRWDAITATELVFAAALEVDLALQAARPPLVAYRVPAKISLAALAANWFAAAASPRPLERLGELAALNAGRYASPAAIPAGTELLLPTM